MRRLILPSSGPSGRISSCGSIPDVVVLEALVDHREVQKLGGAEHRILPVVYPQDTTVSEAIDAAAGSGVAGKSKTVEPVVELGTRLYGVGLIVDHIVQGLADAPVHGDTNGILGVLAGIGNAGFDAKIDTAEFGSERQD